MMNSSRSFLRALLLVALASGAGRAAVWAQGEPAADAPGAAITAIRYHVEPARTRVWFETTGSVLYTHYSPDPLTLVIDLPGVDISALAPRTIVGSKEVESVVATELEGTNGRRLSRLEIRLASIVPFDIARGEGTLEVVFEGAAPPEEPEAAAAPELAPPATTTPDAAPEAPAAPDEAIRSTALPVETAPAPPPSRPATVVRSVHHRLEGDLLTVTVEGDGSLNYTSFRLDEPRRLVFDFSGVVNAVPTAAVSIDALGVHRARIAQFRSASPRITRLVFDLDREPAHRAVKDGSALRIYFAPSAERLAQAVPSLAASAPPPETTAAAVPEEPLASESPEALAGEPASDAAPAGLVEAATADGTGSLEPVAVVAQRGLPAEVPGLAAPEPPAALPEPPPPQEPGGPETPESIAQGGFRSQTIGREERQYTGELISLDFKDGDIQDIFRLFADISGLNIVVQPGVQGRITLKLTEVPWDQALELILKTNKLGYVAEGNVIRIAPLSELAQEEAERRRLAEEQALAGELLSMTRILSYAKAQEVEPLLRRNLSPRGDIVIDERTNTIIVTDLEDRLENIDTLINTLDTPIPGVEIEARIIVTTRNFSRNLGIQWGFTAEQSQALGNATELVFPNSVLVSGQPIGSNVIEEFKFPGDIGGGLLPPQVGADDAQRGYAVNLPFAGTPTGAIGLSLGSITGAFSIDAALTAAERRGQVRIISAPKIITQNNTPAQIKQGVTFPVQVVANNTVTVQFKDAVLQLDVTPQITSANTIILDIVVNNDSLDFGQSVNGIPSIITQSATTQVLVPDGSTTVIGGVFVNQESRDEQFVPLLHRIPILGSLFRAAGRTSSNQELLIFLTPRIRKEPT